MPPLRPARPVTTRLLLAAALALATALSPACGAPRVSLGPGPPPTAGQPIAVRGVWLKLKGDAVDALFHIDNLTAGPVWVPMSQLKCAKGRSSGWADPRGRYQPDGNLYLAAGTSREILLICREAQGDAPGPFRVIFDSVLGPDATGQAGAQLARWFVWEVPAAALDQ